MTTIESEKYFVRPLSSYSIEERGLSKSLFENTDAYVVDPMVNRELRTIVDKHYNVEECTEEDMKNKKCYKPWNKLEDYLSKISPEEVMEKRKNLWRIAPRMLLALQDGEKDMLYFFLYRLLADIKMLTPMV